MEWVQEQMGEEKLVESKLGEFFYKGEQENRTVAGKESRIKIERNLFFKCGRNNSIFVCK